jgi:hypothetical protein
MAVENDGWAFGAESVSGDAIKQDQEYEGCDSLSIVDCRTPGFRSRLTLTLATC